MSSPRHLWSGDWEHDSTAAARELARRRAQIEEPGETPPEIPSPRTPLPRGRSPRARSSAAADVVASLRGARKRLGRVRRVAGPAPPAAARRDRSLQLSTLVFVTLLVLLTAGVAFGATMLLESGAQGSGSANSAHSMLGIDVAGSPYGIVVTNVVPGSPAQAAGLQPGDLISQINNQMVGTVDGVSAALGGLHAGDTIEIGFTRGVATFTATATLAGGGP